LFLDHTYTMRSTQSLLGGGAKVPYPKHVGELRRAIDALALTSVSFLGLVTCWWLVLATFKLEVQHSSYGSSRRRYCVHGLGHQRQPGVPPPHATGQRAQRGEGETAGQSTNSA
jgi:hypothetical protein